LELLPHKFENLFAWTYKDIKMIPLQLVQHCIKFDTSIPFAHQAKYRMIPNYVTIVNQDLNKGVSNMFHSIGLTFSNCGFTQTSNIIASLDGFIDYHQIFFEYVYKYEL